jgi:hypothetical protein
MTAKAKSSYPRNNSDSVSPVSKLEFALEVLDSGRTSLGRDIVEEVLSQLRRMADIKAISGC